MTDPNTTAPNPLPWVTVSLPDGIAKILTDKYLTDPIDVVDAPIPSLEAAGIPLGIVTKLQRCARIALGIQASAATATNNVATGISTPVTTPAAVEHAAIPLPPGPPAPAALTATPIAVAPAAPIGGPQGIYLREPPVSIQIREQIAELATGNMEARAELARLGVNFLVVDGNTNLPLADKTMAMRMQFPDGGAPDDMFWDDSPVAELADVGIINLRTPMDPNVVLMAGKSKSGVRWADLGVEGLIRARCIYKQGLDGGEGERSIFEDIRTNGELSQKAAMRLGQDPQLRLECENEVAPRRRRRSSTGGNKGRAQNQGNTSSSGSQVISGGGRIFGTSDTTSLQNLMAQIFTSDDMREFAGIIGVKNLPGVASSKPDVAFAIAKDLGQGGKIENALRYMIRVKPSFADSISRVGREMGISL